MGAPIQIDHLSHRFHAREPHVLRGLSLDIRSGQSISIIGESGCGKSTLLHMLAGLMMPSEGAVRIHGRPVRRPNAAWNMMFQRPGLYPWLNVRQNVALGLQFTGQTRGLKQRVAEMLALVDLADKADAPIGDLSGGQQQRVALARSLAVAPEVILLDEPFSALDAFTRRNLQLEVSQIARDQGITLVLVTHDIDEALTMGDQVVVMGRGPGRFRSVLDVDLPYPRNPMQPAFSAQRETLMERFRASVATPDETAPAVAGHEPVIRTRERLELAHA